MMVSLSLCCFLFLVSAAGHFTTAQQASSNYSDCASNLGTLERALFGIKSNLFELNRIFFPPSVRPTRFIRVVYSFISGDETAYDEYEDCNVTYVWAVGEVLFLQPPSLFRLNSLFFYYPNNELMTLHLKLPIECIELIIGIDGECSCMNDSHMLDILTQQLNIYAKYTDQGNVERTNTFARAVCAGELYNIYYSRINTDDPLRTDTRTIAYIIIAVAVVGPFSLVVVAVGLLSLYTYRRVHKFKGRRNAGSIFQSTKRKNLVALALLGIYASIYILTLDVLAVITVYTSRHEFEPELSGHHPLNLVVVYFTFACDFMAFMFLLCILFAILVVKLLHYRWLRKPQSYRNDHINLLKWCKYENADDIIFFLFPLLLVTPCACLASHFGYIVLAWVTAPSRSTTTLILYYFLAFYLLLILRKSYKLGTRLYGKKRRKSADQYNRLSYTPHVRAEAGGSNNPTGQSSLEAQPINANSVLSNKGSIDVLVFFVNIFLGAGYLAVAVIFIMIVYLAPLASEDLFSYLFTVIQFMIVVVSTQYAYKLLTVKKFSLKRVIHSTARAIKGNQRANYRPPEDANMAEEMGEFIGTKIILPYLMKNRSSTTEQPAQQGISERQERSPTQEISETPM